MQNEKKIRKAVNKAFRRMVQLGTKQAMQRHYKLLIVAMSLGIL